MEEMLREQLLKVLQKHKGVKPSADFLGISRYFLLQEMSRLGIQRESVWPDVLKNISKEELVNLIRKCGGIKQAASHLGTDRMRFYSAMKRFGVDRKTALFNEHFFKSVNTEAQAYWLGFVMADGCVSMTHQPKLVVTTAYKDADHLLKFHLALNSALKVTFDSKKRAQSQHYSKIMCDDLIALGCPPRKSLILQFPNIPSNLLNHFVRGYFDGDGCASIKNKKQKTSQLALHWIGTENFLSKLSLIIGTKNKLRPHGTRKRARCLEVHGNIKAKRIAMWMYNNATIFLERKRKVCFP